MKPKLILTYKCNRSCEFCFQKNINSKNSVISYKDYYAFLSWLKGQGIMTFSALGGEPTVHPDFPRMLSLANSMDFKVDVLTNLLFKPRLIEIFDQNITVCANISPKVDYTNNEWDLLNDNLQALASLGIEVIPSITIYKRNQGVGQVVGFAKKYENIKTARVDLARPAISRKNKFISVNNIFGGFNSQVQLSQILFRYPVNFFHS